MLMTFNNSKKLYKKGMKVKSISSGEVYQVSKLDIKVASDKEKNGFWITHKGE